MPSLMLIVFLVEATVSFINAVGAAKINDMVRLPQVPKPQTFVAVGC